MKKILCFTIILTALGTASQVPAGELQTLRGLGIQNAAATPQKVKIQEVEGGYERSFEEQPPLVPHKVDKHQVTLAENECMDCHSEATYKEEDAPRVADSHYVDRDGKELKQLSSSRYFCNQCHVPQVNAKPLVENTFQAASK